MTRLFIMIAKAQTPTTDTVKTPKKQKVLTTLLQTLGLPTDIREYSERTITSFLSNRLISLSGNVVTDEISKYILKKMSLEALKYYKSHYDFDSLNLDKIKNSSMGKYISFYKYENSPFYPTYTLLNKSVKYTDYQLELMYRIMDGFNITDTEAVELGLANDTMEAQIFKPTEIDEDSGKDFWRVCGGILGNLSDNEPPLKFKEIVEIYKKGKVNKTEVYTVPGSFNSESVSETESDPIIERYASTMVYSNYYESGLLKFSDYLTDQGISHVIYTPQLSKKDTTTNFK